MLGWLCGHGPLATSLDQLRCLLDVTRPTLRTGTSRDFQLQGITLYVPDHLGRWPTFAAEARALLERSLDCDKKNAESPSRGESPGMTARPSATMAPAMAPVMTPAMASARRAATAPARGRTRPAARRATAIREVDVTFQGKGVTLHGTLSMPRMPRMPGGAAGKRLPGYLLVAGSGPQSRKVKAGGVEVFTELANGLAARGAVVLRYDKRTFTLRKKALAIRDKAKRKAFAKRLTNMVPDDFIADARAAFDFLAARKEVDPADITVVGHSQGGSFAPDIVRDKPAARVVLLAPGMQRFDRMLVDQLEHQLKILKKVAGAQEYVKKTIVLLAHTRALVRKIRDPKVPKAAMLMGASKQFYLRHNELTKDMQAKVAALRIPTLILQGDRDLKSIPAVLLKMKPALEKNPKITVKILPAVTHEMLIHPVAVFDEDVIQHIWAHRKR